MLIPRQQVPSLNVETVAHGRFDLASNAGEKFTLVVFYRGLHCPICAKYLMELERLVPEFEARGVKTIAVSTDVAERAAEMVKKIKADKLAIGYGVSLTNAREWGLYTTESRGKTSIGIEEPAIFAEPGVFIVRADGTLYYGAVQTMPFARPNFTDLVGALDFAINNNYPARGEYTGPVPS
ncbi:MAG: AhpC/TSA family protein [Zoogloeaceae bacterium]|nr:AhpC/TSA family protein [Zoogloeaceae bacterium]